MAVEDDVRSLIERVRALQQRVQELENVIGGPTITLESGGNGIVISPQGIVIRSGSSMTIESAADLRRLGAAQCIRNGRS